MLVKLETAEVDQNTKSNYNGNSVLKNNSTIWQLSRENVCRQYLADNFFWNNKKFRWKNLLSQSQCHIKPMPVAVAVQVAQNFRTWITLAKKNRIFFKKNLLHFFKKNFFPKIWSKKNFLFCFHRLLDAFTTHLSTADMYLVKKSSSLTWVIVETDGWKSSPNRKN